jgi:UDP-N-acetylglucosamine--N-acetylmuramyl-(pentapeptide) pyrophosphoryl-undecaprenol N-acetylglucosamine transferase
VSKRRFALVAGGGTGGHLMPALAVAKALGESEGPGSVELVGARRGLDATLLTGEDLPATLLPGRGFVHHLGGRAMVANIAAAGALMAALVGALALVARRRPAVVVAMGGYACVPTACAAAVLGVPVVLVNVDAVPGAANRLVGRFARAAAVAFDETPLARAVVTGVPVRPEVVGAASPDAATRRRARQTLGLPADALVVAAVGGSLGSRRVNEAVVALAELWSARPGVALYHVVGRRDEPWARAAVRSGEDGGRGLRYVQVGYEKRMALVYQASDLMVSRAGANTVAELAVVGVPAVLVPLPGAPGDHQRANARVLERVGAAVVVPDAQCGGRRLAEVIDALVGEPGRLEAMRMSARSVGRPDAAWAVAALARAHARSSRRGAQAAHAW